MSFKLLALALAFSSATSAASFSDVPSCMKWCVKIAISMSRCDGYDGTGDPSCMCSSYGLSNSTSSSTSYYSSSSRSRGLLLTPADYAYAECLKEPGDCTNADLNTLVKTLDDICFMTSGSPIYTCGEVLGFKQADLNSDYSEYSEATQSYYSSLRDSYTGIPSISTTTMKDYYGSTTTTVTYTPQPVTMVGISSLYVYSTMLLPITVHGAISTSTISTVLFTATCPYNSVIPSAYSRTYYNTTYNLQTPKPHLQVTGVAQTPVTSVSTFTDSAGSAITSAVIVTPTAIVAVTSTPASSATTGASRSNNTATTAADSAGKMELGSGFVIMVGLAAGGMMLL